MFSDIDHFGDAGIVLEVERFYDGWALSKTRVPGIDIGICSGGEEFRAQIVDAIDERQHCVIGKCQVVAGEP